MRVASCIEFRATPVTPLAINVRGKPSSDPTRAVRSLGSLQCPIRSPVQPDQQPKDQQRH